MKKDKYTAIEIDNVVNKSLREILNRSIVTTVTTLIPIVSLIFLGANDIFEFNVALFVGLVVGTLSSLFVASQLWCEITKREMRSGKGKRKKRKVVLDDGPEELEIKGINS